ncbi:MAG TPA: hypothetical protein DEH78_14935 [Solibacterales bacterium]|nr:hypothetical protein [Bryobacterales bacterium]
MAKPYRPSYSAFALSIGESVLERLLTHLFDARRCFVCCQTGWCEHREPEIELALAERAAARLGAPAARETTPWPQIALPFEAAEERVRPC